MDFDKEKAAALLAQYGASRFAFGADGVLHAVVQGQEFKIEGERIVFGPSDAEIADAAISKAAKK